MEEIETVLKSLPGGEEIFLQWDNGRGRVDFAQFCSLVMEEETTSLIHWPAIHTILCHFCSVEVRVMQPYYYGLRGNFFRRTCQTQLPPVECTEETRPRLHAYLQDLSMVIRAIDSSSKKEVVDADLRVFYHNVWTLLVSVEQYDNTVTDGCRAVNDPPVEDYTDHFSTVMGVDDWMSLYREDRELSVQAWALAGNSLRCFKAVSRLTWESCGRDVWYKIVSDCTRLRRKMSSTQLRDCILWESEMELDDDRTWKRSLIHAIMRYSVIYSRLEPAAVEELQKLPFLRR